MPASLLRTRREGRRPELCNPVTVETQRIGNSHLRKVSVSESNVLLDEEVLTDPKIQALLLTVLVRTLARGGVRATRLSD